jgi:hypothetical protein
MENNGIFKTMKRQWNILITGSWLDGMENSEIFKTMKRQWNILITGSWLDGTIAYVLWPKTKNITMYWHLDISLLANLDCTFEAGTCGWSNDKTTGLKQWTLHKGRTPSSYTGPSVDQTLKTSKGTLRHHLS